MLYPNNKTFLVAAVFSVACTLQASKIRVINDTNHKVRILVNDQAGEDLKQKVAGKTLRRLDAKKVSIGKSKTVASKYTSTTLYLYEKVGKNSYQLVAKLTQENHVPGNTFNLNLSGVKSGTVDSSLQFAQ